MGKKILVPCLDVILIAFFPRLYTVKDNICNTKLEKGDHYYIQTRHKDLFSHYNLILRKLYEKMSRKHSKIQTKCAHAPWASYNTPLIELIQYGRRIGKKVY